MSFSLWKWATNEPSLKMSLQCLAMPFQPRLRMSAAQTCEVRESCWWNKTWHVSLRARRQKKTLHVSITAWFYSWERHNACFKHTAYICNKYKIVTVTSQIVCLKEKNHPPYKKKRLKDWADNILHLLNPNQWLDCAAMSWTSLQTLSTWLLSEK